MTGAVVAFPGPRNRLAPVGALGAVLCLPVVMRRLAAGDAKGAIDAVNAGFTYGAADATAAMSYFFATAEAPAHARS